MFTPTPRLHARFVPTVIKPRDSLPAIAGEPAGKPANFGLPVKSMKSNVLGGSRIGVDPRHRTGYLFEVDSSCPPNVPGRE